MYRSSEVMRAAHAYTLLIWVLAFHSLGNPLPLSLSLYLSVHVSFTHNFLFCSTNRRCYDTKYPGNFIILVPFYLISFYFCTYNACKVHKKAQFNFCWIIFDWQPILDVALWLLLCILWYSIFVAYLSDNHQKSQKYISGITPILAIGYQDC